MATVNEVRISAHELPLQDFHRDYSEDIAGTWTYSPGAVGMRRVLMVVVRTTDGAEGSYGFWSTPSAYAQAVDAARSAIGRDHTERELIYRSARRAARPAHSYGLSFVDNALWDLAGRVTGQSLTQMLGGFRKTLPAYASTNNGDRNGNLSSKEAVADFMSCLKDKGMRGFKMHSWHEGDKREEAANVRHMRATLGDDVELMLDPACVFDNLSDAIYVGRACASEGFRWYEDPLRPMGVGAYAHKKLREALEIPILQTEHVPGPEAKADFLLAGGTDLLRVDANYDLGVTGCLKTIRFGEALGVNVEVHQPGPVHRHLIASMQNTVWYEIANVSPAMSDPSPKIYVDYSDELDTVAADGSVVVPTGPGIGVEYDWDVLRASEVATDTIADRSL